MNSMYLRYSCQSRLSGVFHRLVVKWEGGENHKLPQTILLHLKPQALCHLAFKWSKDLVEPKVVPLSANTITEHSHSLMGPQGREEGGGTRKGLNALQQALGSE